MRHAALRELSFRFDFEGSKVASDIVSRDERLAHMHRQDRKETGMATAKNHWVCLQ
jgi:hypothetical protein